MKVTYNWLKDFVDIDISAEELAKRLTAAGMEVEELIYQNEHLHHVVVGKILKIERHPQADKLVVCQVDIGSEVTQIVTAATNVFEGAMVPVSLAGADLCNGIKIEKSKLRGVDSFGMFCSGEELGIDDNYFEGASVNGILILPEDFVAGTPIDKALKLDDIIFDIGVTPNRADCMSVIGIAREVCAVLGKSMKEVDLSYKALGDDVNNHVKVNVLTDNCHRYMAGYIRDVKIERSPIWMRCRLNAVGIKPINTLVDITNYVLVEMGQPLHAFDGGLITNNHIIVRQAEEGERLECLNHATYNLDNDVMVIADEEKPMVIAGVIGGMNSCINDSTFCCVLESAVFDLKSIRLTSKRFGVRTDSSARYEKGVNVASAEMGIKRALHLIDKLACGTISKGLIDLKQKENEVRNIEGSIKEINSILGINVPPEIMKRILNSLCIKTEIKGDKLLCEVPPYREDIENNNDLAEEIIRFYGYDKYDELGLELFANASVTEGRQMPRVALENKMKDVLINNGFYETLNFSLCAPNLCEKLLIDDLRKEHITIANPISEDISCLRTSMADALLIDLETNLKVGNKDIRLFEIGRTYHPKELPLRHLPIEKSRLSFLVNEKGFDFFNLKGLVENLLILTSVEWKLVRSSEPYLHPNISADIMCGKNKIGYFGKIHPLVAKNYDIDPNTYYGELDMDYLAAFQEKHYSVRAVSKFPIVERDIAVVVDENKTCEEILSAVKSACGGLYYSSELFDIYRSESLGQGKKSMAIKIKLSSGDHTLKDEEVNGVINKVLKALQFRFGASLR